MSDTQKIKDLEQQLAEADAVAEMKSNFLATMSHEIRTPMQAIYGLLELIIDEKPEARIAEMASTAQTAASGLLEILDDILDLAKMDADKMELDHFEVPVRLLVRGILEALSVKVHGLQVDLVDDIEQEVPFVVVGDPKRLRQILMNLIGNGIKFTEQGTVTVRVTTNVQHIAKLEAPKVALRFEIVDTGIGMSQEVRERLFQAFEQADNSTTRKFGGTGLGLSIAQKLVKIMGGEIGVDSTEGKGSTFWFEIPTEAVDTDATTVELPHLDGISVLSIEDHPQGAKEIMNSLRSMGAVVESCPTYAEGLELVKRRPFDVAVVDQGLPDGLGLDLIKEITEIRPSMGLVMYTVRDDIGLSHSLKALGAKYLTKPASRAGLGEAVQDCASKTVALDPDRPRRLLIAEDTASVQDILGRQLDKIGVDYDFADDGQKALEAFNTGQYGLLISDLHMPGLDGYQLVEKIRDDEKDSKKHSPVIVLTADVQMSQRDVYMGHGFDECLLKPVSLGQMHRLLIRWGLVEEKAVAERAEEATPAPTADEGDSSVIDREAFVKQMGAFDESSIQMMHMFVEMTEPMITKLKEAEATGDQHQLGEIGHSLKGAARSACCPALGDAAGRLQDAGEQKKAGSTLAEAVYAEFERVKVAVAGLKA